MKQNAFYDKPKEFFIMKKSMIFSLMALFMGLNATAVDLKTFENEKFTIGYPSDWEVTYDSDDCLNLSSADGNIFFDITYNDRGPTKEQLKESADNWEYMKTSSGHKVDQKMVKDDYAMVRSIETDEDDGEQTVVVWFVMVSKGNEGFSGSIQSPINRANEAIDVLVGMLATLSQK